MLIDDRELLSISVEKVDGLAKVGLTNKYSDLSGIPTEFNPEKHTHELATESKDGFMSANDFKNLLEFQSFKTIQLKNSNGVINIDATKIDDKFIIKAGKNVAFEIDNVSKTLTISNTFELDESQLIQGEKGQTGDAGDDGITWRPSVDSTGIITWSVDSTRNSTPPTSVNIKGKVGKDGTNGKTYKPVYNESTKKIEYTESNDDKSPAELDLRGKDGEKGTRGITWRPVIDEDKNLTYEIDNNGSTEIPKGTNIAGEVVEGQPGKDADPTTWQNISGLPVGTYGEVLRYTGYRYDGNTPILDSQKLFDYFNKLPLTIAELKETFPTKIFLSNKIWNFEINNNSLYFRKSNVVSASITNNGIELNDFVADYTSIINFTQYQKLRSLYYLVDTHNAVGTFRYPTKFLQESGIVIGAPISILNNPSTDKILTRLELHVVEVLDNEHCTHMQALFPLYSQLVQLSDFEFNCTYICLTYNLYTDEAKLLNVFKLTNGFDRVGTKLEPEKPTSSEVKDIFYRHRNGSGKWTDIYFKYSIPESNNNFYEIDVSTLYRIRFKFNESTLMMESHEEFYLSTIGGIGCNIYTRNDIKDYLKVFHKYNKVSGVSASYDYDNQLSIYPVVTYSLLNTKEDFEDALPKTYPDPYMLKSYTTPTSGPLNVPEAITPTFNFVEPDGLTVTPIPYIENNDTTLDSLEKMFAGIILVDSSINSGDSKHCAYTYYDGKLYPMSYTPDYSKNLTYINNYTDGTDVVTETKYTILI